MSATLTVGPASLYLTLTAPLDSDGVTPRDDIVGLKVWYSTSSAAFDPDQGEGTLAYNGSGLSVTLGGLLPGTTYYVKYAFISDIDPETYTISNAVTGIPLGAPQTIDISGYTSFTQAVDSSFTPATATLTATQVNVLDATYSWTVTGATPATASGATLTITPLSTSSIITVTLTVSGSNVVQPLTKTIQLPVVYNGQPGQAGTPGTQAAYPTIYQWTSSSTPPARPTTTSSYNWSTASYTPPSGWAIAPTTNTTPGSYLWAITYPLVSTAATTSSTLDWTDTSNPIRAVAYNGTNGSPGANGAAGSPGAANFVITRTTNDSSAPTSAEVLAAIGRAPVAGDIAVVSYNNYNNAVNYKYTTSWALFATYLVGSLIVEGTITGDKLVANTVTASKIDARGLEIKDASGNIILSAGVPLSSSNIVPAAGWLNENVAIPSGTLNANPQCDKISAWEFTDPIGIFTTTAPGAVGNNYIKLLYGSSPDIWATSAEKIPVDPTKRYRLTARLYAAAGNTRSMYVFVRMYSANGTQLGNAGWGGTLSGYIFGGLPTSDSTWREYGDDFGAGTTRPITSTCAYIRVGVWGQYSGSGSGFVEQGFQDLRLTEVTDVRAVNIATFGVTNCVSNGNTLKKTSTVSDWDAQGYSIESYVGGAHCSFTPDQITAYIMAGLNTDPTTSANYASLDYAWYIHGNGNVYIYESGSYIGDYGAYTTGTVFSITYDGSRVRYYKNGIEQRSVSATITNPLYFDSSFLTPGASLSQIKFGPMTSNAWSAISGAGKPADYATVGKSYTVPFDKWNLQGQSVVSVSNGKVGTTALQLTGNGGYPRQDSLIPIDRSKKYRTRFWARPSSNNTYGLLYFSLRQFQDSAGLFTGTINGGRSPYKPSGISPSTHNATFGNLAWGEYSFIWDANDWQTGVYFVQPEFLNNYNGAPGYWDIQDFTFEEVTEVVAAKTAADTALAALDDKLSKSSASVLSATVSVSAVTGAGFRAGNLTWDSAGNRTGGSGVAMTPGGLVGHNGTKTTFAINSSTGEATFSGNLSAASGSFQGSIYGGNYTGYSQPAAGTSGFYLGPEGLLMGNAYNDRYIKITQDGNFYAPGFSIVNGSAKFSGSITAPIVNTEQIIGNATSVGYNASSTGSTTSITVYCTEGTSAIFLSYYLGSPTTITTYTSDGKGWYANSGSYGPTISSLTMDGGAVTSVIVAPSTGNHTITLVRANYSPSTMRLNALVLKR